MHMMADFQNVSFLQYFFLTQSDGFLHKQALAYDGRLFKIVSFLQYLVFFQAVYLHRTTLNHF